MTPNLEAKEQTKVWKRLHPLSSKREAFNAKLALKYVGSLEVRKILFPVVVDLRDEKGRWYRHVHIQDLKPTFADQDNNEEWAERDNADI